MADALPTAGQTVSYQQPEYYSSTGSQFAGGVQDLLGQNGYINDIANNWYDTTPGQGALGQFAQYDPNKQQQFMNPYTQNVVNANTQQSNQNLFENVIPQLNSTFTGAGQFGSSRNADFMNRAIRDQQQNLMNTNANTLMGAQNQAATQYQNWQNMGNTAAQQDFTNWQTQANYPLSALSQVGTMFQNMRSGQPLAVSTSSAAPTTTEKLGSVLSLLGQGLNDTTTQQLLDWAGLNFTSPTA
jgi:hypothetical protein